MKDRTSRPESDSTHKLTRINGLFLPSKNVHNYSIPNDPDNNLWFNECMEDFGNFWELPNKYEVQHYYFKAVNIREDSHQTAPAPYTRDEFIDDYYKHRTSESTNKLIYRSFGSISAFSLLFALLA